MTLKYYILKTSKLSFVLLCCSLFIFNLNQVFAENYPDSGKFTSDTKESKINNSDYEISALNSSAQNINITYYISNTGNDLNAGTTPEGAWQSISKVNSMNFEPGDIILFKGGQTFNGNLVFDANDSGSPGNYIQVGSFGTGRAIINAGTGTGFVIGNCNFLKIKNIDFTGNGRKTGNTGNGLYLNNCTNISVDSVKVSKFQHSGINAANTGNNLSFTNINATENGYAGIFIGGLSKTSMSDIYIGYCTADNNPGDPTVTNNQSGNGILAYVAKKY